MTNFSIFYSFKFKKKKILDTMRKSYTMYEFYFVKCLRSLLAIIFFLLAIKFSVFLSFFFKSSVRIQYKMHPLIPVRTSNSINISLFHYFLDKRKKKKIIHIFVCFEHFFGTWNKAKSYILSSSTLAVMTIVPKFMFMPIIMLKVFFCI